MQNAADLKELIHSTHFEQPSYEEKCVLTRNVLTRFIPSKADASLLKELDRIIANLETTFINQRSVGHLAKLAYAIYYIRAKLSRNMTLLPFQDHLNVRVYPNSLYFTFGSKPILGILAHAHLKDRYETFNEEQIFFSIQKVIPKIQLLKDSLYSYKPPRSTITTLYFEICKKSSLSFRPREIKQLKALLQREIRFSIEQLVPHVLMIQNEEELLKNIFILSREIRYLSDLPQVMVVLDQQTQHEMIFTIILVRLLGSNARTMQEYFSKLPSDVEYTPNRYQIVRYLRKKYPIEASVFRLKLMKNSSLLRADPFLNFYIARQKITRLLTDLIGEFRDYNGGIILQQRETLSRLRSAFPELTSREPDVLENFYYSLSPIEVQATLSLQSLKTLFELFLEAKSVRFIKPSDFFLKFKNYQKQLFIVMRTPDEHHKTKIDALLLSFEQAQKIVTFTISMQNTYLLGYLFTDMDAKTQSQLIHCISTTLKTWQSTIESRQVLSLGLEHSAVSLDPRVGGDEISAIILKMLFEGLMRINREGKLEKGAAQDIEISSDQKTYLFTLRSAFWANRSLVSAHDFEYAWKKILSPSFHTPFAYLFYPIKNAKLAKSGSVSLDEIGVKALNDHTLKVELEFPSPYFLELTSLTLYSPVNRFIDQTHPNWIFEENGAYPCNGAFLLKKNHSKEGYALIKNKLYWDSENIKLDEISIFKSHRQHCYELFQKDMNHWAGSPLGTWDPSFIPQETDECISISSTTVYWFVFNTQRFPFNHKKIRQALSMGIDRLKLQEMIHVSPAFSPIPPLYSQIQQSPLTTPCRQAAQALFHEALDELNISLQNFPIVSLSYLMIGSTKDRVVRVIKEEWESIFGIRCDLEALAWKELFTKMTLGDFQVGGMGWESWIHDPIFTLNAFREANEPINFPKWENRQYQEILHLAEREQDLSRRRFYYLQAEALLLDEMPVIPIYSVEALALKKKNFHIQSPSLLIDFKWGHFT